MVDTRSVKRYWANRTSTTVIAAKRKPVNALAVILTALLFILYIKSIVQSRHHEAYHYPSDPRQPPLLPNHATPGTVIASPGRQLDVLDAFANYNRIPGLCSFSSLDLHEPFFPLCPDKQSFLDAASGGGRSGVDEPYRPKDCDMRWFHTEEICEIMSRFDAIWVIGDSMMRNLAVALHVYLRADLHEGPRAQWNKEPDDLDCHCKAPFETAACMWYVAFSSSDVWKNIPAGSPHAIKCPQDNMAMIECEWQPFRQATSNEQLTSFQIFRRPHTL